MPAGDWVLEKFDQRGHWWYLRVLEGRAKNLHARRRSVYDWAHCPVFATAFPPATPAGPLAERVRRTGRAAIYKVLTPAEALAAWRARNDGRRPPAPVACLDVGGPPSDAVPLEGPDVGGQVVADPG